ncbi:PA14 domain-containing protein, partial [Flavobacterium sp. 270]|uniref:PA14 domain-containing protein n=1 Tax=Flavobacterium sp. 270 TaxID=2512114 RepID=UPI0010648199
MTLKLLLSFLFFLLSFFKIRSEKFSFKIAFVAILLGFSFTTINAQCNSGATAGTVFSNSDKLCVGENAVFWSTGWSAGGSWSSSNPAVLTVTSPSGNSTVTGVAPGVANVIYTVTQPNCTEIKTAYKTITVLGTTLGTVGQISGTTSQCNGSTNQVYSIPAVTGGAIYTWTIPNGNGWTIVSGQNTNSITVNIGSGNGNIGVTVSNPCASGTNSVNRTLSINVSNNKTTKPTISGSTSFCPGGNVTLTSSNQDSYLWSTGETTKSIIVSTIGSYTVKTTKSGSCQSDSSDAVNVSISSAPAITNQPVAPAATCSGNGTQTITVAATGTNLTYVWKKDGTTITNGGVYSGQGTATLTLTNPTTINQGSYTVQINGTCTPALTSNPVTVTVNENNTVSAPSSTQILCVNTLMTTITHTTTGATGIGTITNLPNGVSASWASNTITISGTPTSAGTYTYNIPLNGGCGTVNATGTITVNPVLNASVSIASSPTGAICPGTSVTFTATPTNGGTPSYQWKLNGGNVGANSATYTTNTLVNGDTVTCVMTSNASPCLTGSPATSNSITMTVNSQSTIPTGITGTTSIISGSSTILTVAGGTLGTGASAEWFTGSCGGIAAGTGNSITVSPTTTTTYYVRYKGTCNITSCINITVNVCVPLGDQTLSTTNNWTGYVYKWTGTVPDPAVTNSPVNATTQYIGTVTEPALFDRNFDSTGGAVTGTTVNICGTAPSDNFFIRYKMNVNLVDAGEYSFTIGGDDGTRLYIDGVLLVGRWNDHGYTKDSAKKILTAGPHEFILEYYENVGGARASFTYGMPKGDPTVFGINTWNVYGYNVSDISLPVADYAGTYVDSNLSFDTTLYWNKGLSPSAYAGWQGLPMPIDDFALSYKRQGFPCGNYKLDLANFDDNVEIYLNGTRIFNQNGYQTVSVPVGTYLLNKDSKIEVRLKENGGDANLALNFTLVPNVYNGTGTPTATTPVTISSNMTLQSDVVVCSCTIDPGVTLTVPSNKTLTVYENITVGAGGKLLIQNGGALIQENNSQTMFSGDITNSFEMQRTTTPVRRYDLTYWGSPVTAASGFTLKKLSPAT